MLFRSKKKLHHFGLPWENDYGYAQATRVGKTIYLSGQISHDEDGTIVGLGDMAAQIRQAYVNIEQVLASYGATLDNLVDETLFVTDMAAAMAAAGPVRRAAFGKQPALSSTIVQIQALAIQIGRAHV